MSMSKTSIHAVVFAAHDHLDIKAYKDCVTSIWVYFAVQLVPSLLASFHQKYLISRGCSLRGGYGNIKIDFREKCCTSLAWNQRTSSMSRYGPFIKRSNKKAMEKLTENVKIICLQTPIWKVSCHRSIISDLLGSFNGKWQGFLMVCSESELRLVELFTFLG